jgi:DNA-binding transcriptional ArsR family regulator
VTIFSTVVNNPDRKTIVFAALADVTRRRIIERLARRGELRVTTLAKPFRMSLPAFSRHLTVLERAQLIQRRRKGRLHLIRSRASGLLGVQKWIGHYVAGWEHSFDALDELIERDKRKENP